MSRQIIDLNGENWRLGQAPPEARPDKATWQELERVEQWLPATVPGNVRADLLRAGRLSDLAFGRQTEDAQWVDGHCWWLIRDLALAHDPGDRVHLVLRGVDYIGDLFLNGHSLGRHEGMFSPQVHDVTDLLQTENRLALRILGSHWLPHDRSRFLEKLLNRFEAKAVGQPGQFPHRRDTLKCQMGFGWDFSPRLRTMGIWDDVYAIVSKGVFLRDLRTSQRMAENRAKLTVSVGIETVQARRVVLRYTLRGESFDCDPVIVEQPLDLAPGASFSSADLIVSGPRLWWPWDQGHPDLYRLEVEILEGGQCLDSLTQTVGLRRVEMDGWKLYVSGRPVFARGANWVPADILPGRVTAADYRALLVLAQEANMNMLRVWGGGLREKRAFYDLCDRLGILVWQEFPFACAFFARYPRSPNYLRLVESESRAIVHDLRNHPSLVIWCGGNEFRPEHNEPLVTTLQQVVAAEDPTRPFLPASPIEGDSHNWKVWHQFQPPSAYRHDAACFASEFGLQAPPSVAALRRFIPLQELWPPGPSWAHHGAGLQKLQRYARPFLEEGEGSLEAFVVASQRAQAHGLQVAIEHHRRRKVQGGGGVLIWQFNEPWPAISWALVDHYRQPKLAYRVVKRLFAPLLVSLDYPLRPYGPGDEVCSNIWLVNDLADTLLDCRVAVVLEGANGQAANRFEKALDVAADSALVVGSFCWTLPPGNGWWLRCRLEQGSHLLAENEYDLTIHDGIRPTLAQRLWAGLAGLVIPA